MFGDTILNVIFGVLVIFLIGIFVVLIDSIGSGKIYYTNTTLVDKTHTPEHNTTTYMLVGKVMVPQVQHHSESYTFTFKNDMSCDVSKDEYLSANIGDSYKVGYKTGLIFKSTKYCKSPEKNI